MIRLVSYVKFCSVLGETIQGLRNLEPQTFQQFQSILICQDPCFLVSLVVWIQILVKPADIVAGTDFVTVQCNLHQIDGLHCFAESPRRFPWNAPAAFCYSQQFLFSRFIGFFCGHLFSQIRITVTLDLHSFAGEDHAAVNLHLVKVLDVVFIKLCQFGFRFFLDSLVSLFQDDIFKTYCGFTAAYCSLVFSVNNAGSYSHVAQLVGHVGHEVFLHGLASPVRDQLITDEFSVLFRNGIWVLFPRVDLIQLCLDPTETDVRAEDE